MDSLIHRRGFRAAVAFVLSLVVLRGADPQVLEYQVKAAFLLNFTRFVDWPAESANTRSTFALCVVGEDPFGPYLDRTVEGEAVDGRKIVVRRIRREGRKTFATSSCGILYVAPEERNVAEIVAAAGPGVLTVGEGNTFLDEGGMIAFVLDNRRVRFDADPGAAKKAGIRLSSRLLNVARIVR